MQEIRHAGRFFRIANQALAQRAQSLHDALGLTSTQGYVLGYLTRRQLQGDTALYAKDVEQHFGVKHSSVSGVLQRLESKGFLTFEPDDTDRRCKKILLTQKAMECHERIEEHIRATEQIIFRDMSRDEQDLFMKLLLKAAENVTEGRLDVPPTLELGKEET